MPDRAIHLFLGCPDRSSPPPRSALDHSAARPGAATAGSGDGAPRWRQGESAHSASPATSFPSISAREGPWRSRASRVWPLAMPVRRSPAPRPAARGVRGNLPGETSPPAPLSPAVTVRGRGGQSHFRGGEVPCSGRRHLRRENRDSPRERPPARAAAIPPRKGTSLPQLSAPACSASVRAVPGRSPPRRSAPTDRPAGWFDDHRDALFPRRRRLRRSHRDGPFFRQVGNLPHIVP